MDGGASSRRDASSTDTPDASSPGTGGGDAGGCNAPIKLLTANNCGIGMLKCLAEQVCYTTPEQCLTEESDRGVSCNTSVECGQGNVCCALLPNVDLNACPVKAKPLNDSSFSTACRKSCPSPELPICAKTVDCAAGKRCVAASSPGAFLIGQIVDFGVCL